MDQNLSLLWSQPDWFEQASRWIQIELDLGGFTLNGSIEQPHIRPWSTVLRIPTNRGDLYFKATAPALAYEPALTQALSDWRPDCIPPLLATNLEQGWMLMPDCGTTLRSQIQSTQDLWRWEQVLPLYAELQIELAERQQALLDLGTLDRRLALLSGQYEQILTDRAALLIDQPDGLTTEAYRRLQTLSPQVALMCQQLVGYGLPETLHHDDFHDANIFIQAEDIIFFDWGESCVTHPFFSMLVPPRITAYRLKLADDDPRLTRLRDAYLEPWTRYGSGQILREAFQVAHSLAMICRALTWHYIVSGLPDPFKAEHAEAVPGWLEEFLQNYEKET